MLSSLTLSNFKTFEDIKIPLAPLTLLAGVNGSGKSTVLQALAVLRQSFEANCLDEGLLLNGELVELGTGKDVLFESAVTQEVGIDVFHEGVSAQWRFRYGERDDLLEAVRSPSAGDLHSFPLFQNALQFLRADRISPAAVYSKSYAQAVRRRFLGVRGQFAVHFLAYHQDELVQSGRRRKGADAGGSLLDQTNAWLGEVSPGVSAGSKELGGTDLAQLWFTFGGKAGLGSSNEYRPTNVGFGLTYALPIIVACLAASPGDVLLIENPEAHLHPRGQAIMAELLCQAAADDVQVIFETHSDHVLNAVRLAVKNATIAPDQVAVHYCERQLDGTGTQLHSPLINAAGRLSKWPQGFFDEWEKALMELV